MVVIVVGDGMALVGVMVIVMERTVWGWVLTLRLRMDNDCELMFDSDSGETLMEPPAESEQSRQLDQMLAWATKTLVDC